MKKLCLLMALFLGTRVFAQDMKPFVPDADSKYFDFWEGTWYLQKDDGSIDSSTYFRISRTIHSAAYLEEWSMGGGKSLAIRAWDKTNQQWGFTWISPNALYQVWDSKKIDGNWYIYKRFDVNGDKYLSRQGFLLQPDGTVWRISEKSYDEKKWELRFKQVLKKAN